MLALWTEVLVQERAASNANQTSRAAESSRHFSGFSSFTMWWREERVTNARWSPYKPGALNEIDVCSFLCEFNKVASRTTLSPGHLTQQLDDVRVDVIVPACPMEETHSQCPCVSIRYY